MRQEYPDKNANKPVAFLIIFQGVETMQKIEIKSVARKILIYFGAMPVISLEKGYVPILL